VLPGTSHNARVPQVLVVAEAYGYSPDWAHILYHKVVLDGDFVYLEELKRRRGPLTSGLFEDIFHKYGEARGISTALLLLLLMLLLLLQAGPLPSQQRLRQREAAAASL